MKLTREERYAIFRGEHRALRRPNKPKVKAGDKRVLSWTRGGQQVVDRESGATVLVPRKPNVWIEFMEPELRGSEWLIRFTCHDEREPLRLLAATPGPHSEAGLKTRWRGSEQVPDKSEYREHWNKESERGYGGSGRRAVDPLQAVDDETLAGFATVARMNFAEHREVQAKEDTEEARRRRERAIRDRLRERMKGLSPKAQLALLAAIEQAIQNAGEKEAA